MNASKPGSNKLFPTEHGQGIESSKERYPKHSGLLQTVFRLGHIDSLVNGPGRVAKVIRANQVRKMILNVAVAFSTRFGPGQHSLLAPSPRLRPR